MPDFLLEIGCEEIPARMIDAAQNELAVRVGELLEREALGLPAGVSAPVSTPRRLSVMASIADHQMDITGQVTGPAVNIAFKDGQPTPAAHAFARKAGVEVSQLERVATPKGEYLAAKITRKGRRAAEILTENLPKEISSIHWPKNMYWHKPSERFVRPVRWLVAMLDSEVIPLAFAGVQAGNQSHGHRSLTEGVVQVPKASAYVERLREAKVLGRGEREQQIRKALDAAARTIPEARWREDKNLLETVVNLTEFPSAVLGNFDREFLELPEEVLVTVMRDHQKYFAVEDTNGKLFPHFLAVLNTDGDPKGIIRHGHERVLRARFNDARFFWETDQKHPLRERVQWLKHVTFQKDLGSYYEKTKRVQRLCSWLSELIRQGGRQIRPGVIHKAALLSKADLTTELVKEFTELQGKVGGLYARVQQLDRDMADSTRRAIADTIYDHYKPESMEDSVPRTLEGSVLSIADKADTIAGMFALGLQPTGSKDPFALRRQANGIVKTIAEHKLSLSLSQLFTDAREAYRNSGAEKKFSAKVDFAGAVRDFFRERLEFYLRDVLGYKYDVVNAVLAAGSDDVGDAVFWAQAFSNVRQLPDFEILAGAFKRIKNILRQANESGKKPASQIKPELLADGPEKALYDGILDTAKRIEVLRQVPRSHSAVPEPRHDPAGPVRRYEGVLIEIGKLRPLLDTFFDKVMVMVDDERVRENRLALLQTLLQNFSTIADFSEIVTEGKA